MNDYDDEQPEPQAPENAMTITGTTLQWDARAMFDSIAQRAAASIVENVNRELVSEVKVQVSKQIAEQVGAKVSEVLDTSIQPTNEWGEPKGKPTTLRDLVGAAAREYLGTKVDKDGRPNSYNADSTRIDYIVKKAVEKEFDYRMQTEVKQAVEQAKNLAVAKVGAVVGDLILKLK
jgi:hypothetical protein